MLTEKHRIATERRLGLEGPFRWFVHAAWPALEPGKPFLPGWHIDCIAEHIQAMHTRQIRRLVCNVPPGHMKSLLFCVLYNAWAWIRKPEESFMYGSNDLSLPVRDGGRVISLVQSAWFKERWGDRVFLASEKTPDVEEIAPSAGTIFTNARSYRISVAPGGKGVGRHAGVRIVDDGNKPNEMDGKQAKKTQEWLSNTFLTRVAAGEVDTVAIVMQRLGVNDLSQYVLDLGGWDHLCLPFEYHPRACVVVGAPDSRQKEGDILWPEAHTPESMSLLKANSKSDYNWETQGNQNAIPKKGPVFDEKWLQNTWDVVPEDAYRFWVWDLAFEGESTSDYVVGQLWATTQARAYLLRQVRAQCTYKETRELIREGIRSEPAPVYIERKANGHAALSDLASEFPGLLPIIPQDSKFLRAMSVQAVVQSGSVLLPSNDSQGMHILKQELVTFPNGRNDDCLDVFVHALRIWLSKRMTAQEAFDQAKKTGVNLEAVFGRMFGGF
jgi:predicted phage terminase large subunit-like protein